MTTTLLQADGRLPQNIIHFCRALRRAGIPIGSSQIKDAIRAVEKVGFTSRLDFFVTLRACFVTRTEHLKIFEQVFNMFWRDPEFLENMMQMMLPMLQTIEEPKKTKDAETRAREAMLEEKPERPPSTTNDEITFDAQLSTSNQERLGALDFEQMTLAEMRDAELAISKLKLSLPKMKSRRTQISRYGTGIDMRRVFSHARRNGGEIITLPKKRPRVKKPNIVAVTDISGSMSTYSRMILHFIHSMAMTRERDWVNVEAFTFGTRLSNVTNQIKQKDPDMALRAIGNFVQDWDGGTHIGESLKSFNKDWSRRVLGTDTIVLLVTDGLERGDTTVLQNQMTRLQKSCRQLIWLNPLLRFDGFAPHAQGIKIMLPFVDRFAACHNLNSLSSLAQALNDGFTERLKEEMLAAI